MSDGCSGETRMLEKKVGVVICVYTLGGEYCIFLRLTESKDTEWRVRFPLTRLPCV
jgi:hypothetical protein